MAPDDEIFSKDYQPPPSRRTRDQQKSIEVSKAFFKGLPDSRSKKKRRRLTLIAEGRVKQRITSMRQYHKDLGDSILREEVKAEAIREKTRAKGTDTGTGKAAVLKSKEAKEQTKVSPRDTWRR